MSPVEGRFQGSLNESGEPNHIMNPRHDFHFRKLDMPLFDGSNPDGLIIKAKRYYAFHRMNNKEKLKMTVVSFEGDVLLWY